MFSPRPLSSAVRKRLLSLFLLLASPAVFAQSISPLDPPDTAQYLRWGPLWARPGFAISDFGYDSNVLAVTDQTAELDPGSKVGDYFIAVTPRLKGLVLFGHRAFLTFDASLQLYAYAQQSDLDYFNVFSNARLTVPFRRFGLYGDIGFDRTRDRPYDAQGIRPLRKTYPLGAGLIFKFGWRSDAEIGYAQARFTADDPSNPCPSSCAINSLNDRKEEGVRLKARYLAFGRTRVLLEASRRTIAFSYPATAAQRDGDERRQFLGLDFGLGGRISGTFRIGHANFDLVDPNATGFNGPVADIALAYNFGDAGSRLTLIGARDVRYTVFNTTPLYVYTGGDLTLFKYFNRLLGLQVGAGRATLNFLGDPTGRVDTDTTGTLGLLFRVSENSLGRSVEYSLRYTRFVINSTESRLDQNRGTIGFGASFGY